MKRQPVVLALIIIAFLLSACSKTFYLPRGEEISKKSQSQTVRQAPASSITGLSSDGKLPLLWEVNISEGPTAPLTIGAGQLVFCGSRRRLYFFDVETGLYRGRLKVSRNVQSGLLIVDSLAYFGVAPPKNKLVCLNLFDANEVWSVSLKDITQAPIIMDNRLYVVSATGRVCCLDHLTGKTLWQDSVGRRSLGEPIGNQAGIYVAFDNGLLKGYNSMTGETILEAELGQPLTSPVVTDGMLLVATIEGRLFALDKESGEILWCQDYPYPVWSSPVSDGEVLYFGDNGGTFRAVNEKNGALLWQFETDGIILSSATVVGDFVLFGCMDRHLYCLDRKTGLLTAKRSFQEGVRFPAVTDGGRICVAADDGYIQCFGE